jgi:sugar-specific transcriptional regulator TrmB
VYLALLRLGRGGAQEIAAAAGIKRTTVYMILEQLCNEGLASLSFIGKRRIFCAETPERLRNLLESKLSVFENALPVFRELYKLSDNNKLPVRYYEGIDGVKLVINELLKMKGKEYFYFGSISLFVKGLGRSYLENFIRKRIELKIRAHAIRFKEDDLDIPIAGPGENYYRQLRYIPRKVTKDTATILLYDNKVIIHSAKTEGYGMIIESESLHALLKNIWLFVWDMAEEP